MEILTPTFVQVIVQEKGHFNQDFRAFLECEYETMRYSIRGYGKTAGQAADDAYSKMEDRNWDMFVSESWEISQTK